MRAPNTALRILLVEDNPGDARLIQILLSEEMAGDFRMTTAPTLAEAVAALTDAGPDDPDDPDDRFRAGTSPSFDVVLLDLTLPDSQGLNTLRRLRSQCASVPVVVLSGLDDEVLALRALQSGAEDYLVKGRADGNLIKRSSLYAIERYRMRRSALLTEAAFQATDTGIVILGADRCITRANPAMVRMTGYAESELVGHKLTMLAAPRFEENADKTGADDGDAEDQLEADYQHIIDQLDPEGGWEGEIWNQRQSGDIYPVWLRLNAVREQEGLLTGYVGILSDITHRKKAEAELRRQATRDPLTGLPNRAMFLRVLEDAVDRVLYRSEVAKQADEKVDVFLNSTLPDEMLLDADDDDTQNRECCLLFIDLDGFKNVNDTYGHGVGDEVLKVVAGRLKSAVRGTDHVARLAGDEFVIILSEMRHIKDAAVVATKIITEVALPINCSAGQETSVSASVGIALCPRDATSADGLVRAADAAMYRAKRLGKNRWCSFRDVGGETP